MGALFLAVMISVSACAEASDAVEVAQRRVTNAEESVAEAEAGLDQARAAFCAEATDYILAIDRYGKLFTDETATVGDLETRGADLAQPRESTVASAEAVQDAHAMLNEANVELAEARAALKEAKAEASDKEKDAKPVATPPPSEPIVAPASVDRVKTAESDLESASQAITDETSIKQATESFTSAAFALEVAWINLFADAGCLSDEQADEAAAAVRQYTGALQTQLKAAGYLQGEVDGVYGPATVAAVEALQEDAGLPVTGLVDRATRAALDDALSQKGESVAEEELIQATSVQTLLKAAGYWPGAIDGEWTPELEAAIKEFQKDLGVKQTGVIDAATLAAFEELLVEIQTEPVSTPTVAPSDTSS